MHRTIGLILACVIAALPAAAQIRGAHVRVGNSSQQPRMGELVEVPWSKITAAAPALAPSAIAVSDVATGSPLPWQLIEADGGRAPDLLLVRVDVPPGGSTSFSVVASTVPSPPLASLTDARFVLPREDIAWESDRIAFRMYGPALAKEVDNGIDVWTKRVRTLIVQKWYKAAETAPAGHDPYHEDHGEGADFFNVGRTLGAGGCALISADTLLQPGVFAAHRIIATGPLRAQFELAYAPVHLGGRAITQKMMITIDAGSNFNRIDVLFEGGEGSMPFAAGVVKRKGVEAFADTVSGTAGLWGLTTEREEEGFLGTGVVMPKQIFHAVRETQVHLLVTAEATSGKPATYYAGAGWTRSGDFSSKGEWTKALRACAEKIAAPLTVEVSAIQK